MSNDEQQTELWDTNQLAAYLQLDVRTVHRYTANEGLPYIAMVGSKRYRKASVDAWLDSRERVNPPKKKKADARKRRKPAAPRIIKVQHDITG